MQIVALAILHKKDSQDFFAQVHSFWDKWEKQHDGQKNLGFAHVFGSHVVFATYLKNYALEQRSPWNLFQRVFVGLQLEFFVSFFHWNLSLILFKFCHYNSRSQLEPFCWVSVNFYKNIWLNSTKIKLLLSFSCTFVLKCCILMDFVVE